MRTVQPAQLAAREIGLFLDVDGTLLDLAPRPEAVAVEDGLLDSLAAAEHTLGGALALISGRPIADLDRIFAPLRLRAAGVHGAEIRYTPSARTASLAPACLGSDAWQAVTLLVQEFPGSFAENKEISIAIHYPSNVDPGALKVAIAGVMTKLAATGRSLQLLEGRDVFEIQPRGFDKGKAIAVFMAEPPFAGRIPVFIGDDEIDRAAFAAAVDMGGLAFSVGVEIAGVSGAFATPAAVRAWLHGLAP